jgi:hypothetical protein
VGLLPPQQGIQTISALMSEGARTLRHALRKVLVVVLAAVRLVAAWSREGFALLDATAATQRLGTRLSIATFPTMVAYLLLMTSLLGMTAIVVLLAMARTSHAILVDLVTLVTHVPHAEVVGVGSTGLMQAAEFPSVPTVAVVEEAAAVVVALSKGYDGYAPSSQSIVRLACIDCQSIWPMWSMVFSDCTQ